MAWNVEVENKLRPCYVEKNIKDAKKVKALFHRWVILQEVIGSGLTIGSAPGGQISKCYALIELEDGSMRYIYPSDITFIDHPFTDYSWPEENKEEY